MTYPLVLAFKLSSHCSLVTPYALAVISALYDLEFTGESQPWPGFLSAVQITLQTRDPYTYDVLNSIFTSQSKGICFADFKCVRSTLTGTPDVILKDDNHVLEVVGELKVPWVREHFLDDKLDDDELRSILAQPIICIQRLGCVYGFLSNYNETIFPRQLLDDQGIDKSPCCLYQAVFLPCSVKR